jgi:hypothetical protein
MTIITLYGMLLKLYDMTKYLRLINILAIFLQDNFNLFGYDDRNVAPKELQEEIIRGLDIKYC